MSSGGRIFAFLLVFLAGCSTVPHQPPPEASVTPDQSVAVARPTPPKSVPAAVPTPAAPTNHFNLDETWIPLERWSQACGYGVPRRIDTDTAVIYSFAPTNGGMAIKIGNQSAWWDGLEYRLGFAPATD